MNGILTKSDMLQGHRLVIRQFQSKAHFISSISEASEVNIPAMDALERAWSSDRQKNYAWYGFNSSQEIIDACQGGWDEGLRLYHALKNSLSVEEIALTSGFTKRRRKKVYGEEGDEMDMCRYVNREYDTMYTDKKIEKVKGGKYITIWTTPEASLVMRAEEMMWRGIAAVVLTDILENAGYRVCLKSFITTRNLWTAHDKVYCGIILLKSFNEALDIETALFTGGCPSFYRYYVFRNYLSSPEEITSWLGIPTGTLPEEVAEEGDVVLGNLSGLRSLELAREFIINILRELSERGS